MQDILKFDDYLQVVLFNEQFHIERSMNRMKKMLFWMVSNWGTIEATYQGQIRIDITYIVCIYAATSEQCVFFQFSA